ncbi:MAG: stringent starvation protein B [Myxococcaceae bacterium]
MERTSDKKERLSQALERGLVMVHLDARRPGVVVPGPLAEQAHLRLNLSYRFEAPNIELNDDALRATLSFGARKFRVNVPWAALFAIRSQVTQEFWTYPDDVPAELFEPQEAQEPLAEVPPPSGPRVVPPPADDSPRRHLRLVK